jgi:hypothetical protein
MTRFPPIRWRDNRESRKCDPVEAITEGNQPEPVPESMGADQEISAVT